MNVGRRSAWLSFAWGMVGVFVGIVAPSSNGVGTARAADGAKSPPNVVLIISDDHAWTDYGFMGHPQVKTPRLDRLAAESLTFKRGYVPSSLCCPSLATILTGRFPHQHKITSNDPPLPQGKKGAAANQDPEYRALRRRMIANVEQVPTLPRWLADKGYLSFQSGKWWQGDFRRGGFTNGMTHGDLDQGGRHGDQGLEIGRKTMQPIFDFIDAAQKDRKPFFVWYAPMMPHDPHTPPERLLEKYKPLTPSLHVAKYWAMVEWFDETCGQLFDHLEKRQLSRDTLVVYVTDNGWIQNPQQPRYAPKSKQSQYDGGLRTPIMLRWPGVIQPQMSDHLVSSIDLAPTILNAVGIKIPADLPGLDLRDEAARAKRTGVFGECFTHNAVDIDRPASSLRWRWTVQGQAKLIVPCAANEPDAVVELYDLASDPHETKNLASARPDEVAKLRKQLDEWWKGE